MKKPHYRSIFISDTHLGFRGANPSALNEFLKTVDCEYLYLIGDIFDIWELRKRIHWSEDCNNVLRKLLKLHKNGTKIFYIPGNHDEALRNFLPFNLGGIEFLNETYHHTKNGEKYLIIHGDQFVFVVGHMKWLAVLGSTLYDWLIVMNRLVNKSRSIFGFTTHWSLSGFLKQKAKKAVSFMRDFETASKKYAEKLECVGVITGHIHNAKIDATDKIKYLNCGDWVETLSWISEDDQGVFELHYWL